MNRTFTIVTKKMWCGNRIYFQCISRTSLPVNKRFLWTESAMLTRCSIHKLYPTLCNPMDCSRQALLSRVFFRQEFWSGLPFPPPRDLPDPGIQPMSPASLALQAYSLPLSHQGSPVSHPCCAVLSRSVVSNSLRPLPGSSVHGDSPSKNTGEGCSGLLQGSPI